MKPPGYFALILVAFVALSCATKDGLAVTIVLNDDSILGCRIVREFPGEILVDAVDGQGNVRRQAVPRSRIRNIKPAFSEERLSELAADSPNEYRLYAEELGARRADPEAREMATQLYLIAAYLSPEKLGNGSLLGMANLAYRPADARRFRSMAALLGDTPNANVLGPVAPGDNAPVADDRLRAGMLEALRMLRTGKRREAQRMLEASPTLQRNLEYFVSADQLRIMLSPTCTYCDSGFVECPKCNGAKKLDSGAPCPACRSRGRSLGRITCDVCQGQFRSPPTTDAQLAMIVGAEYRVTTNKPIQRGRQWTHKLATAPSARALNLLSITEYDPRACLFRDGKWVVP